MDKFAHKKVQFCTFVVNALHTTSTPVCEEGPGFCV